MQPVSYTHLDVYKRQVLNFVKRNGDSFSYAEERRLFYVALTRTKNNVYLLAPYFKS